MSEAPAKSYVLKDALCPVCGKKGLTVTETEYCAPNFGKTLLTLLRCTKCDWRRSDVASLEYHEPRCYKIRVEKPQDLQTRVVRSRTATIEIPELGVKIRPGPIAEAFISNIEGILERIEDKAEIINEQFKSETFFKKLDDAKRGEFAFTLIIKDHSGNSAIISNEPGRVKIRKLSEKELKRLTS